MNNYETDCSSYSQAMLPMRGTGLLTIRDLPELLERHAAGPRTLDYGCGSGRMTRLLASLGMDVTGADVSPHMIAEARRQNPGFRYQLIKSGEILADQSTFDLVFSCLVLFEISSLQEMKKIFSDIHRVLKPGGIFLAVTGSEEMYSHNWLTLCTNYAENQTLTSGARARVKLTAIDLELTDYYWTDEDYKEVMAETGFRLRETRFPKGLIEDDLPWKDEFTHSPYVIYVMRKAPRG